MMIDDVDIVEVISKYIKLRIDDGQFYGICPICKERMFVDPTTQTVICMVDSGSKLKRNVYEYAKHIVDNRKTP